MKVLVLNGSPRMKGNTREALNQIIDGIKKNIRGAEVELVDIAKIKLSGCINCDGCRRNGGNCILSDDSAELINKVSAADIVIFGTPVYWWGISAQLKMAIDKFYSKSSEFHQQKKQIGIVAVGAAELEDPEYRIIEEQFKCICDFLGWNMAFYEGISAADEGDVLKDNKEIEKLSMLWKAL